MGMSRKHFVDLADILKNMKPVNRNRLTKKEYKKNIDVWEETCSQMATFCSHHNRSFQRGRFMGACGVGENE